MSAQAATLTRTFNVGRYTATVTAGPNDAGLFVCDCNWQPHFPTYLTPAEKGDYRRHMTAIAIELGRLARNPQPN